MNDLQKRLLVMMKEFHRVCEENDITYYMNSGTVLGAIRHKGFIPWDDDVDLGLYREDYEKLLALPQSVWDGKYYLATFRNTEGYPFAFAKLYDVNTTKIEKAYGVQEWVGGIYLDIFPHDGAGNNKMLAKLRYYRNFAILWNVVYSLSEKTPKNFVKKCLMRFAKRKPYTRWIKKLDARLQKKHVEKSKYVANYIGRHRTKEVFEKRLFGEPTLYTFEDTKFYGPSQVDEYLTQLYGEYMQPPKEEECVTEHPGDVDLNTPYK